MKKIFLLIGTVYNGTIVLVNTYSSYMSLETAMKVKDKLNEINEGKVVYSIKEIDLYENEQDVPVMNEE